MGDLPKPLAELTSELEHLHRQVAELQCLVGDRRRTEIALRRRLSRIDALRRLHATLTSHLDLAVILDQATRMIPELLDVSRATVLLYDPASGGLVDQSMSGGEAMPRGPQSQAQPPDHGLSGACFSQRRVIVVNDCSATDVIAPEHVQSLRLRSTLAAPITVQNRSLGVLRVDDCERTGRFDQEDVDFFTLAAEQLGTAIENAQIFDELQRAETELRHREEIFRRAIENAEGVPYRLRFGATPAGNRYEFMGDGARELLGIATGEITPQLIQSLVREVTLPATSPGTSWEEYAAWARAGRLDRYQVDMRLQCPDGEERWVSDCSIALRGESGEMTGALGILQDITRHKRTEQALRESNDLLALRSAVATAVTGSESANELGARLLATLRAAVPCDAMVLSLYDAALNTVRTMFASDTVDGVHAETPVKSIPLPVRGELHDRVILGREPLVIHRTDADLEGQGFIAFGNRTRRSASLLWVPLVSGNRVAGMLSVQSYTRAAYTPRHVDLVMAVAQPAGPALEAAVLGEEVRRSESHFRALAENIPGVVYLCRNDEHYSVLYLNDAIEGLTGIPAAEFQSGRRALASLIHPEDVDAVRRAIDEAVQGRQPYTLTYRIAHAGGAWRWVEERGHGLFDARGELHSLEGTLFDITARRQAEREIQMLAHAVRSISENVCITDMEGRILFVNDALLRNFGHGEGDLIGRPVTILQAPADESRLAEEILRASLAGGWQGEVINRRQDGTEFPASLSTSLVRDGEGRAVAMIGVSTDITERRRAEREREALQAQLLQAQKLESLGVLAGGIAHDFNNLLTGILGNAQLAQIDLPPGSPARAPFDEIVRTAERAAALTRQMLAYAGKGALAMQALDLSVQVREMARLLTSMISKKVELRLDLAESLPSALGDAAQIQQLVMNLVINGAEAIGDRPGRVVVSTGHVDLTSAGLRACTLADECAPGPHVHITVEDDGMGMDAATLARIFDPFFTTKFTGRGLGLAAVHGIVRGHRAALAVRSAPGCGTWFRVHFPATAGVTPAANPPPALVDFHGQGTILVVDDEEMVRSLVERVLTHWGYTVVTAPDGREALAAIEGRTGDLRLVLLDMTMPVLDGVETCAEIRRRWPALPVVLMSGYAEEEARRRAPAGGPSGFLEKPFSTHDLAAKVHEVLTASAG